jgi:hypothetical protein
LDGGLHLFDAAARWRERSGGTGQRQNVAIVIQETNHEDHTPKPAFSITYPEACRIDIRDCASYT